MRYEVIRLRNGKPAKNYGKFRSPERAEAQVEVVRAKHPWAEMRVEPVN
jgi:hypothetical protein